MRSKRSRFTRSPPTRTVNSGALRVSRFALSREKYSVGSWFPFPEVVAEPVRLMLEVDVSTSVY